MVRMVTPGSAVRHLGRINHIARVFIKYGFGEFFRRIRLWEYANIERRLFRRKPHEFPHLTEAVRLRMALEELGPTFVKLGQMLSTRPDLMPVEYIRELEKLQGHAEPVPVEQIKQVIEEELGKSPKELFDHFSEEPIAAASLAQVHLAEINGQLLAVKAQRPNIADIINMDLDIMRLLAGLWERYSEQAHYIQPVAIVGEFANNIRRELDFRIEAGNMLRFASNFKGVKTLRVPTAHKKMCTPRIIVMEYLDGINISETERLKKEGYKLKLIARRGADISFRAALEFGFFHTDPHPGNILVLHGNVIGLLDYGQMATMSTRSREKLARLVYFISKGDEKRVSRAILGLMEYEESIDAVELESDIASLIQEFGNVPLCELRLGEMLLSMMRLLMKHRVRFYAPLIWVTKGIGTMEDIANRLGADFSMLEVGTPYAEKIFSSKFNPIDNLKEAYFWLMESAEFIKDLPYESGVLLRQLKKGRVKIEFEHMGLEPLQRTLSRTFNRLSLAIIIAAFIISSSLMVLSGVPPLVGEISALGLAGFVVSFVLTFFFFYSVMFRNK